MCAALTLRLERKPTHHRNIQQRPVKRRVYVVCLRVAQVDRLCIAVRNNPVVHRPRPTRASLKLSLKPISGGMRNILTNLHASFSVTRCQRALLHSVRQTLSRISSSRALVASFTHNAQRPATTSPLTRCELNEKPHCSKSRL